MAENAATKADVAGLETRITAEFAGLNTRIAELEETILLAVFGAAGLLFGALEARCCILNRAELRRSIRRRGSALDPLGGRPFAAVLQGGSP